MTIPQVPEFKKCHLEFEFPTYDELSQEIKDVIKEIVKQPIYYNHRYYNDEPEYYYDEDLEIYIPDVYFYIDYVEEYVEDGNDECKYYSISSFDENDENEYKKNDKGCF